jgi:hypothetical protein
VVYHDGASVLHPVTKGDTAFTFERSIAELCRREGISQGIYYK